MRGKNHHFLCIGKRHKLFRLEIGSFLHLLLRRLHRLRGLRGDIVSLDSGRSRLSLRGGLCRHRLTRSLRSLLLFSNGIPEPACKTEPQQNRNRLFLFVHFIFP